MARKISAPRGTHDLLPEEAPTWERVEAVVRDLSSRYGFERIDTPIFERIELFARGLGESSDAVEKEMFRVSGAKGSEEERSEWALRPEPTAGIVRAYIEHGMHVRPSPLRLWMLGPMFRYARPQAGRYREFTQWDVEVIGDPGPMVDAELIELAHRFYAEVGLRGVVAHLNSIGDMVCRARYRDALTEYFAPLSSRLSADSQRRLQVNPLRVLDDKDLDPELAAGAPKALDYLCEACREHFEGLRELLGRLGVRYEINHRLVRGLDYYALGGGGRYDGLIEVLGGRPAPAIGFGLGIDRTVIGAQKQQVTLPARTPLVAVVSASPDDAPRRLEVATALRDAGLRVRTDGLSRTLSKQLEAAAKAGARWAVLLGEPGLARATLRDLESGDQQDLALDTLAAEVVRAVDHRTPSRGSK
ncbi:MAG: histidine--tRNA ligase [Chloroflexi bacterium]|nr:MAG: histidine--tRNA ligase [Chloroflexota bacterium]